MRQSIARACRSVVPFSSLCRSQEAESSAAVAEPDGQPASLLAVLLVLARVVLPVLPQGVLLVLEQDAPPVSLLGLPLVSARIVPLVSQQVLGSQELAAPPVSAQVCWLRGVDALQAFQVGRVERAPVGPVPVSPLARQPVFPLASPQVFHSLAFPGALLGQVRAAQVSPPAPLLAAHLAAQQARAQA